MMHLFLFYIISGSILWFHGEMHAYELEYAVL